MSTVTTGEKPVKRIPRAQRDFERAEAEREERRRAEARAWFEQFVTGPRALAYGNIEALRELADKLLLPEDHKVRHDEESPPAHTTMRKQRNTLTEAMRYFGVAHALMLGLTEMVESIHWIDAILVSRLELLMEYTNTELSRALEQLIVAEAIDVSLAIERAIG